jgi:predicted nucleic acid-binding protein
LALLRTLTERPGHQFLPEELPLTAPGPAGVLERAVGHRQVADAFLIAVAAAHGAGLTTFDAGMRALAPDGVEIVVLGSRRG